MSNPLDAMKDAADAAADKIERAAKDAAELLRHHGHNMPPVPTPVTVPPVPPPGPVIAPIPAPSPAPVPASSAVLLDYLDAEQTGLDPAHPFAEFAAQFVAVTPDSAGAILNVHYPAGSSAPSSGRPGGAQICVPFSTGPRRNASVSYDIRFPLGFQWEKGGKLPGLYGGVEPFSGGGHNPNGWSLRLMWRGTKFDPALVDGAAEIYGYPSVDQPGAPMPAYGYDWMGGQFLPDNLWHRVQLDVTVNTPGNADGVATLSIDGTTVVTRDNLMLTAVDVLAGGLFFSTFYGGHDSTWAPTADMDIDFRHFTVN